MLFQLADTTRTPAWKALPRAPRFSTVTTTDNSAAPGKTNVLKTWQYVAPKTETLAYDEDGNLRADARWKLIWDAENRLAVMEERVGIPHHPDTAAFPPPRQRIEFVYDSHHRRCAKKVFRWNSTLEYPDWEIWAYTLYFYDGWNLVAELDALNACTPLRTYAWGVDLSGSMDGAGGVGGLLMVKRHMRTGATDKSARYLVHSDANGNVKGFASIPLTGTTFAATMTGSWDYDAFGNRVSNTIPVAHELCRIGFSSKYEDPETGWLNYTFRPYRPDTGAWLNRDPIGEEGGRNLYGFVGNDAVNRVDRNGLDAFPVGPPGQPPRPGGAPMLPMPEVPPASTSPTTGPNGEPQTKVNKCNIVIFLGHNSLVPQGKIPGDKGSAAYCGSCYAIGNSHPGVPENPIPGAKQPEPMKTGNEDLVHPSTLVDAGNAAFEAAVKHAETLCKQNCCDKIEVSVECYFTPGDYIWDATELFPMSRLCHKSKTVKCKK